MATYLRKYICGKKALDYWKVPNLRGVIEPENAEFPLEHVIFTDRSLYVPSCKLDIEYDSQTHHDNPTAYSSDSIRSARLEDEGYQLLSVKPVQLYNLNHFETLAKNIARRIGKRIRIRARKFFESFVALRDLLAKESHHIRSRFKKTRTFEFPKFPGVLSMYPLYLDAWKRLSHYPNQTLVLTRAP